MKIFEELLENYWILKSDDEELYYEIKDGLSDIKEYIKSKFGYKIIVTPLLIKLEKIPGIPCDIFGIKEFKQKEEYVLLCMILMFLEDKAQNEQFILSQLVDYIKSTILDVNSKDILFDFTLYSHRKMMVNVLKFVETMQFIKKYDGDIDSFSTSIENEVLYQVTGISKYFMRNFSNNISNYSSYLDIWNGEKLDLEQDKGDERRHRINRRIFTEPVIYIKDDNDLDYLYIKNYKNIIETDVQNFLDSKLYVNKNGAYILLDESKNFKDVFPNNRAISEIVLFTSTTILEKIANEELKVNVDGTVDISKYELDKLILETKEKYQIGFSVEYRTKNEVEYLKEIKEYLKELYMLENIKEDTNEYKLMPIIFRTCGKYPKEFLELNVEK